MWESLDWELKHVDLPPACSFLGCDFREVIGLLQGCLSSEKVGSMFILFSHGVLICKWILSRVLWAVSFTEDRVHDFFGFLSMLTVLAQSRTPLCTIIWMVSPKISCLSNFCNCVVQKWFHVFDKNPKFLPSSGLLHKGLKKICSTQL